MMAEAPQIAGLGEDGHGIDPADPGHLAQSIVVDVLAEQSVHLILDHVTL